MHFSCDSTTTNCYFNIVIIIIIITTTHMIVEELLAYGLVQLLISGQQIRPVSVQSD